MTQEPLFDEDQLHALFAAARPSTRLPYVIILAAVVTSLVLALILSSLFGQNADLEGAQRCRAEIAAESDVASNRVLLIISNALARPPADDRDRADLAAASEILDRALARRAQVNDLCT